MPQLFVTTPETIDVLGASMTIVGGMAPTPRIVIEHVVPPGYGVPLHIHQSEDEAFFVLEGEMTFMDARHETKTGPGALISVPRGVPHGFRNDASNSARVLVLCGPQAAEMFRHLHRARPRQDEVPMICSQYGVVFAT